MLNSERYFVCEDCSDSTDWLFWSCWWRENEICKQPIWYGNTALADINDIDSEVLFGVNNDSLLVAGRFDKIPSCEAAAREYVLGFMMTDIGRVYS